MSDKIKAIEDAAIGDVDYRRLLDAIEAARLWAAESDARFEQAKKSWDWSGRADWHENHIVLNRYFGGDE